MHNLHELCCYSKELKVRLLWNNISIMVCGRPGNNVRTVAQTTCSKATAALAFVSVNWCLSANLQALKI